MTTNFFCDKNGKLFTLYADVWKYIVSSHPEMEKHLNEIRNILAEPAYIFRSRKFYNRHLYYKEYKNKLYFVLVVDNIGKIIKTFYITDRIKEGELIWRNQP